jgi:hypothetical protein
MSGCGGAKRDRTADLLHAMQALSQLSYGPDVAEEEIVTGLCFSRKQFVKKFHDCLCGCGLRALSPTQQAFA